MGTVELVLGPLVVAVLVNTFLFGICVNQIAWYIASTPVDRLYIRFLVVWVVVIDCVHIFLSGYMIWHMCVTNFENPDILLSAPWPYTVTPAFTVITACPIQHFLAWRVRQFSGSNLAFAGISVLSLASTAAGLACAVRATRSPLMATFSFLMPNVAVWLASALLCDMTVSLLLLAYLRRGQSALTLQSRTNSVVSRLIRSGVETASFGILYSMMCLLMFLVLPATNVHVVFAMSMGRVYSNTLLSTLNARPQLRDRLTADSVNTWKVPTIPSPGLPDTPPPISLELRAMYSHASGSSVAPYAHGAD